MGAGRRGKGYKKVSAKKSKNRIIGVEMKNNNPMMPIDKVRTVAKPECNKTVLVKNVTARVSTQGSAARLGKVGKKSTSYILGDGTEIVNFRTGRVNVKAGKADMLKGDGTDVVDFLIKEDK